MKTKDARSFSSETQEEIRRKAVQAVLEGKKHVEAARIFGVTRHTVDKWMKLYQTQGRVGLNAKPKGRPRRSTLKGWQAAQMVRAIEDHCPDQLKLPYYLWTREAVQGYVEKRFGIRRSVWTIGRWLAEWGFTPQKAATTCIRAESRGGRAMGEEDLSVAARSCKARTCLDVLGG